jgi:two-component system, NarL family, sensor kinase
MAATIQLSEHPVQAIDNFERAIKVFLKYPDNRYSALSLGSAYINMGLLHHNNNDYETAISYYLKAEDVYLETDPLNTDLALLYGNISITYGTIYKYEEALKYSKKALSLARNGKDKLNLMNALYAYGGNLVNAKKGDLGLAFLDSSKILALELNNLYYLYSSDFMTGMYFYNTKQYESAIEHYSYCLNLAKKHGYTSAIGNNFLNISACEAELKKPKLAQAHLDSSAKYIDYSIFSVSKQMYFENYAEVYKQLGNFTKAFAFKDSVGVVKDSLYQADNIKQMEFRQSRFNYEKRQKEINQLEIENKLQQRSIKQRNILNYILSGGAICLIIIIFLSYRTYQQKQKFQQQRINKLETEKQLTATQDVLKGEEQERTRLAKDLHDGLGGLLSGVKFSLTNIKSNVFLDSENVLVFERSLDMLDQSISELRRVAHNMMPEVLVKFGLIEALKSYCDSLSESKVFKMDFQSIGMEKRLTSNTEIFIYRVVQELLNNVVKHANANYVLVQLSKHGNEVGITVEDNGIGIDKSSIDKSAGSGWTNIQSRIDYLKGKIDVQSAPGEGTSVYITIPI